MPPRKNLIDAPPEGEMRELLEEWCANEARNREIKALAEAYYKENGDFTHAGLYVDRGQAIYTEVLKPTVIAKFIARQALPDHMRHSMPAELQPIVDQLREEIEALIFKLGPGRVNSYAKSRPDYGELYAFAAIADQDAGSMMAYGSASISIRKTPPENNRWPRLTLAVDEEPRPTVGFAEPEYANEDFEDEDGDYSTEPWYGGDYD